MSKPVVVKMTPVNRVLADYKELLLAIADDLDMDGPLVVRRVAAASLREYAMELEALAYAIVARERGR